MKLHFDKDQIETCFTFMKFSGATSISFNNQILAKCGSYHCLIIEGVVITRALNIRTFINKINRLYK